MVKKILILLMVITSNVSFAMQRIAKIKPKKFIQLFVLQNQFPRLFNSKVKKTNSTRNPNIENLNDYLKTLNLYLEKSNLIALQNLFQDYRKISLYHNTKTEIISFLNKNLNDTHMDLIQLLIKENILDKNEILLAAASRCAIKIVKFLIENGANINYKNGHGNTPLILTAKLLEKTCNDKGHRAALELKALELIEYMLQKGAKITKNNKGLTALCILKNLNDKSGLIDSVQ